MVYVERNPVRARTVRLAWRWAWLSAAVHCGEPDHLGVLDLREFREEWKPAKWQAALREPEDDEWAATFRGSTHTGQPLATDRFLARPEARLGRRLRPLPVGRPRKKT